MGTSQYSVNELQKYDNENENQEKAPAEEKYLSVNTESSWSNTELRNEKHMTRARDDKLVTCSPYDTSSYICSQSLNKIETMRTSPVATGDFGRSSLPNKAPSPPKLTRETL